MKMGWLILILGIAPLWSQEEDAGDPTGAQAYNVYSIEAFVPPPPRIIVPPCAFDQIEGREDQSKGRMITVNRVRNPGLPDPEPAVRQPRPPSPPESELVKFPPVRSLAIGATVYDRELTHFMMWFDGQLYRGWSNIDFFHLACFSDFESRGRRYSLMMMPGRVDTSDWPQTGENAMAIPDHPTLPEDEVAFAMTEGDTDNQDAMASIMALHEVYVAEEARLKVALAKREECQRQAQAWREAHPPQPRDLNVSFWVRKSNHKEEGESGK